jgi:predicted  nucleic acid-binding Zn-ribbon protein
VEKSADEPLFRPFPKPLSEKEVMARNRQTKERKRGVVSPKTSITRKPKRHQNKHIPQCVNCGESLYEYDPKNPKEVLHDVYGFPVGARASRLERGCPLCGKNPFVLVAERRAEEDEKFKEAMRKKKLKEDEDERRYREVMGKTDFRDDAGKVSGGLMDVAEAAAKYARDKIKKRRQKKNIKGLVERSMKKAWEQYKISIPEKEDEPPEEILSEDYPDSNYQKYWEGMEEPTTPRTRKLPTRTPEEEKINEERKLKRAMSYTPAEPEFKRDEVAEIANSMRQTLGKDPQKVKSQRHSEAEDAKIKEQLNTLWEDTGTRPMTEKKIRKNMTRMYGEPAEELPETESPPPIFYKTIEPTKPKEKS